MGFIPGFCFLSEIPSSLKHPRHKSPRSFVPAGSVGIAGWQTGIYGLDSPGGWQIIGRTPHKMFDKNREKPFLLRAGDKIKFIPSSKAIFS
jgi:inhibitor of KinA